MQNLRGFTYIVRDYKSASEATLLFSSVASLAKRDQTEKKNGTKKQKTASPGVESDLSARSSNDLTTSPQ